MPYKKTIYIQNILNSQKKSKKIAKKQVEIQIGLSIWKNIFCIINGIFILLNYKLSYYGKTFYN